jgi:hypothetical protein
MSNARTPSHTHTVSDLGTGTPASGKYLDGAGAWTALPAGSAAFRTDSVGNLGAAHTSTLGTETWLTTTGTLNANHVETIAGRAAGKFVVLRLQQDATGGRTLQISDGTTPTSVTINSAANAVTDILIICKDATDFDVVVLGASGAEPTLSVTGTTGNLGTTQTVDFQSVAREKWLAGTLNGNLAVTVSNPVAGSRLRVLAVQDGTGGRTLTIAGQAVTIPTTATTGVAMVLAVWLDATTFRVESSGVYTESDPNAVLKSLGTTKGDTVVWTASGTPAREAVGADGTIIIADSSQTNGRKWGFASVAVPFSKTGAQTVATGAVRYRIPFAAVIESVAATVGTAPTGASLIVDVNKNGTTIFTTQANRPTIAAARQRVELGRGPGRDGGRGGRLHHRGRGSDRLDGRRLGPLRDPPLPPDLSRGRLGASTSAPAGAGAGAGAQPRTSKTRSRARTARRFQRTRRM